MLTVVVHGSLRRNSKLAAVGQLLAVSEMTLCSRRERWTMTEARSVEQFIGLRDDITLLSLCAYLAELAEAVADEDSPNPELLPLCLNTLFALSEKLKAPEHVKPAFELRLMTVSGFEPFVGHCAVCGGKDPDRAFLDLTGGTLRCDGCGGQEGALLGRGALEAMRYIISCDSKKLFSYSLSEGSLKELTSAAEGYTLVHLDRSFRTLDYYKTVRINQ